jgi:hypothetical protein
MSANTFRLSRTGTAETRSSHLDPDLIILELVWSSGRGLGWVTFFGTFVYSESGHDGDVSDERWVCL